MPEKRENMPDNDKYNDIINLPRHVSSEHPQMPRSARAAQFAPFAALSGFGDEIDETARLTDDMHELDDGVAEELNRRLVIASRNDGTRVRITYFVPDEKKRGGRYAVLCGCIKECEPALGIIKMSDGSEISIDAVVGVEITA